MSDNDYRLKFKQCLEMIGKITHSIHQNEQKNCNYSELCIDIDGQSYQLAEYYRVDDPDQDVYSPRRYDYEDNHEDELEDHIVDNRHIKWNNIHQTLIPALSFEIEPQSWTDRNGEIHTVDFMW